MLRIPKTKRGLASYIISVFIVTFSIFVTSNVTPTKKTVLSPSPYPIAQKKSVLGYESEQHLVTKVIDGDTFVIATGEKIRLIGVNAPETVDPRKGIECYGKEASEYLSDLILQKQVELVRDISDTDSFGRLLRYVYLDNEFINEILIKEGYAHASTYAPDVKYSNLFKELQREAFLTKKGIWSSTCIK